MTTQTTYTTKGSVRGSCGHTHRTISGALRCLERDRSGCKSQGGYSDRSVYDSDGRRAYTLDGPDGRLVVEEWLD